MTTRKICTAWNGERFCSSPLRPSEAYCGGHALKYRIMLRSDKRIAEDGAPAFTRNESWHVAMHSNIQRLLNRNLHRITVTLEDRDDD